MKRWITLVLAAAGLCAAVGVLWAADDDVNPRRGGRMPRRAWGRVEDLSTKKKLLAIKTETEEEGEVIQIFQLTPDTRVRKEEKVMELTDLKKGMEVIVVYRPKVDDDKYDTALFIRIRGDRDRPFRPRKH